MTSTPDDLPLGTVLDGRYRLERRRERGGYEAVGLGVERRVVIELLDPGTDHAAFERAARAAGRIEHPGCIGVSDFGFHDGTPFVVTELVDGVTLADELAGGRLPVARATAIVRQILRGLAHAHALGFVHGAITPRDVILTRPDGTKEVARIGGFGLPRAIGHRDDPAADQVSKTGTLRGSPTYMAPEQALGTPIDARTDLYAVSVVLYEMLVGRAPFVAREPLKLLNLHVNQQVPAMGIGTAPGFVPPEIEAVVKCGLAKDAADRPQSADEYVVAIEACLAAVAARDADTTTRMSGMSARLPQVARLASKVPAAARGDGDDVGPARRGAGAGAGAVIAVVVLLAGGAIAYTMLRKKEGAAGAGEEKAAKAGEVKAKVTPEVVPTPGTLEAKKTSTPAPEAPAAWRADLVDAVALIQAKKLEAAEKKLAPLRRAHPDVAEIHRAFGDLFLARNWPEETLTSYRAAIGKDPVLRKDPGIIAGAISLLDSNTRSWDAARFLEKDIGAPASAALANAAERDLSPMIRERAKALLARLPAP